MSSALAMFEKTVNTEQHAKDAKASDLLPIGKYPGKVVDIKEVEQTNETYDDGKPNPLFGQKVVSLQVKLEGVSPKGYDPLDGKSRTHFVKVTDASIKTAEGKLINASKLAGDLIGISGTAGKSFADTLRWAMDNAAMYSVGQYNERNTTLRITAIPA